MEALSHRAILSGRTYLLGIIEILSSSRSCRRRRRLRRSKAQFQTRHTQCRGCRILPADRL